MGLAASQARFLCITARKADCEYKSTDLAQQKLELTSQMSDISSEYANALNATTLVWSNDSVDQDYGLTYSLLMTPSAANDYNPYMVTTASGAIVLNSEYASAAKAAGLSKGGGSGSQAQRDKFISALVPNGIVTENTAQAITKYDYTAVKGSDNTISFETTDVDSSAGIAWNPSAGMGQDPLNKNGAGLASIFDLIQSDSVGSKVIDWEQMYVEDGQLTQTEYNEKLEALQTLSTNAKNNQIDKSTIKQLNADLNSYCEDNADKASTAEYKAKVAEYETLIASATAVMNGQTRKSTSTDANGNEIINTYVVDDNSDFIVDVNGNKISVSSVYADVATQMAADLEDFKSSSQVKKDKEGNNVDLLEGNFNFSKNDLTTAKYSVVENGIINHTQSEIESMTIGDLLSSNIVLMQNGGTSKELAEMGTKLLDYISSILGYSKSEDLSGTGLNVDDASASALAFAYTMTKNQFFKTVAGEVSDVVDSGSKTSKKSMIDNSAYLNAESYNKIGSNTDGSYYGLSLSNMVSSFLTYYENALSGADSQYVVGTSVDTSVYVTEDSSYQYVMEAGDEAVTEADERSADFFDELYNNILEHGWREDDSIDDSEYLEASIKNGRYSMSSLNQDGYYYQTRYNETGYMVEVSDTDAIARAEAEFTAKKAEITYKEDSIDLKTKQLDAEISTLNTEYETVKSLISKNVEKIFSMFSS